MPYPQLKMLVFTRYIHRFQHRPGRDRAVLYPSPLLKWAPVHSPLGVTVVPPALRSRSMSLRSPKRYLSRPLPLDSMPPILVWHPMTLGLERRLGECFVIPLAPAFHHHCLPPLIPAALRAASCMASLPLVSWAHRCRRPPTFSPSGSPFPAFHFFCPCLQNRSPDLC